MATDKLITLLMPPALIERLDDFRFANRFPSRAATIKWLLSWALDQAPRREQPSPPEATAAEPQQ